MSATLIYLIIFALLMFFMHRGRGGMGGCGSHSHNTPMHDNDGSTADEKAHHIT